MRIKLIVGSLVLFCAIAISAVAAYFSVIGLAALFAAAFLPVAIMGVVLEGSKLVAAGWLHANWKNPHVSKPHKIYLTAAICSLMLITSMGIYGYLMKAHLEQAAPTSSIQVDVDQRQTQIDQLVIQRDQLIKQQAAINSTISGYLEGGKASGASQFMRQQRGEQARLENRITAVNEQITQANIALAPFKKQIAGSEVELGQWKYLAKALHLKNPESAIDVLIKLLMFAFDPLAVVLMISGTISIGEWARTRTEPKSMEDQITELAPEVNDETETEPEPRGSKVETLPAGENLSTMGVDWISNASHSSDWIKYTPAPHAAPPSYAPFKQFTISYPDIIRPNPVIEPALAEIENPSPVTISEETLDIIRPNPDISGHEPDIELPKPAPKMSFGGTVLPGFDIPEGASFSNLAIPEVTPLEEVFEKEMANDLSPVTDRDLLIAILESNPELLEEVVGAVDEARSDRIPKTREWLEVKKNDKRVD